MLKKSPETLLDRSEKSVPSSRFILRKGWVLCIDSPWREFSPGFVAVEQGRIVGVGPDTDESCPMSDFEGIDARNCIVMPGLINTHTHAAMSLFRGFADDMSLRTWLYDYIFPAEGRFISEDSVYWGAMLATAEMIRNGITTFADGYFFSGQVARVAKETGIRAVVGQGVIDFPTPDVPDPKQNIQVAKDFLDDYATVAPNVYPSLFCHSPYTCSAETLTAIKDLTRSRGALFQIHLSETKEEAEESVMKMRLRPTMYLDSLGILDNKTLVVHAVWLNQKEIELLKEKETPVSHVPGSNTKLSAGIAPLADFIKREIKVGLGTDGCASNNRLDILRDIDLAGKLQKVHRGDATVCNARQLVRMITKTGADVLNIGDSVGSIESGKLADIIVISLNEPHLTPIYDPYSHIVYAVKGQDVRDVIVGGDFLMRNRKLCTVDTKVTMEEVIRLTEKIQKNRTK